MSSPPEPHPEITVRRCGEGSVDLIVPAWDGAERRDCLHCSSEQWRRPADRVKAGELDELA